MSDKNTRSATELHVAQECKKNSKEDLQVESALNASSAKQGVERTEQIPEQISRLDEAREPQIELQAKAWAKKGINLIQAHQQASFALRLAQKKILSLERALEERNNQQKPKDKRKADQQMSTFINAPVNSAQPLPHQSKRGAELTPLEKYVAFNRAYRQEWLDYLAKVDPNGVAVLRDNLVRGLDRQSMDIVELQLEIIGNLAPSRLLKHLYIREQARYDLLPDTVREALEGFGYFNRQDETLGELQVQLKLPEAPLKELLTHSGLLYLGNLAKQRIRGGVVIDAGAYIGDTASFLCLNYKPRLVLALEPHPETFTQLTALVNFWELTSVIRPIHCAAGIDGNVLKLWGSGLGASKIKKAPAGESSAIDSCEVQERSIDSIVAEYRIEQVSLIKFDVEGAEWQAIQGALNTIKTHKPILLVSLYHTARDFFEIKPFLDDLKLGYKFLIRKTTDDLIKEHVLIAYTGEERK